MSRTTTSRQTALRLDETAVERAEALIPYVKTLHGRGPTTRSDVLREAIERGLRELEQDRSAA